MRVDLVARGGFSRSVPLCRRASPRVPFGISSAAGSMPASAGMPSERARIATCDVAPPRVVQKPITRVRSSAAVSEGVRSSAIENRVRRILGRPFFTPGENPEHAQTDVAQIVRALREQSITQRRESIGVSRDRFLPAERRALSFGDRRIDDLEQIRIFEQLLVRGEDRGLRRIGLGVKLRAQRFELSLRVSIAAAKLPRSVSTPAPSSFDHRSYRGEPERPRPTASPGEAGTPNSKFGSVDLRRGGGADSGAMVVVAGAGAGVQPSSPRPCADDRRDLLDGRARIRSAREHMHDLRR